MKRFFCYALLVLCYVLPSRAGSLGDGNKTVTTAGTEVTLSATSTKIYWIEIQALCSNTNFVYVGTSTIDNTRGIGLSPCQSLPLVPGNAGKDALNLNAIYLDSLVNGEGVRFIYETYP